jgi:hypothetical protein
MKNFVHSFALLSVISTLTFFALQVSAQSFYTGSDGVLVVTGTIPLPSACAQYDTFCLDAVSGGRYSGSLAHGAYSGQSVGGGSSGTVLRCDNKQATAAAISNNYYRCLADADKAFEVGAQSCSTVTQATLAVSMAGNGASNAGGTIQWNPNATCRERLADTLRATQSQCASTQEAAKAFLASCP